MIPDMPPVTVANKMHPINNAVGNMGLKNPQPKLFKRLEAAEENNHPTPTPTTPATIYKSFAYFRYIFPLHQISGCFRDKRGRSPLLSFYPEVTWLNYFSRVIFIV